MRACVQRIYATEKRGGDAGGLYKNLSACAFRITKNIFSRINKNASMRLHFYARVDVMGRVVKYLVVPAGAIAAICIGLVMFVMAFEVFCRYMIGSPTDWALEVSTYLFAASVCLGGAYTLRHHDHVGMELVYVMLPEKGRLIAQRVSMITILGFSLVLMWYGAEEVRTAFLFNETSLTPLAMPLAYPLSLVPIGGFLLCIQSLELLIKPLVSIRAPGSEIAE